MENRSRNTFFADPSGTNLVVSGIYDRNSSAMAASGSARSSDTSRIER